MKIDIVIPNYNGSDLLQKNIPKVLNVFKNRNDTKIIIVDDASSEIEKEKLKAVFERLNSKKIILLENEKNYGFSTTVNKGVAASDADLVVLLNSDAVPEDDFLTPVLKSFHENNKLFAVGCMDKSLEGDNVVLRGRGVAQWKNGFVRHKRGDINSSFTFWVSGGSSVIRRDIFEKLGGFDELFNPFYWEDIDLSYRAQKAGYEILFERESVVTHIHSEGAIKKNFSKKFVKKIAFRNELLFIWKNIQDKRYLLAHIFHLKKYLLINLIKGNLTIWKSTLIALKYIPDIIAKRKTQNKLNKISDREIFAKFK